MKNRPLDHCLKLAGWPKTGLIQVELRIKNKKNSASPIKNLGWLSDSVDLVWSRQNLTINSLIFLSENIFFYQNDVILIFFFFFRLTLSIRDLSLTSNQFSNQILKLCFGQDYSFHLVKARTCKEVDFLLFFILFFLYFWFISININML
jgi:hypothetical protein